MNPRQQELVQAWVDGQLAGAEAREAATLVDGDPACRALADNLRAFARVVRDHEPARPVPETREFYWATIRRGIEQAEAERTRGAGKASARPGFLRWLPWLLPAGAAALAAALLFRPVTEESAPADPTPVPQLAEHRVEAVNDQITTLTFYSAEDAMTVVWVGEVDLL